MGTGPDAWTPVNGGLTATNKINRRQARPAPARELVPLAASRCAALRMPGRAGEPGARRKA